MIKFDFTASLQHQASKQKLSQGITGVPGSLLTVLHLAAAQYRPDIEVSILSDHSVIPELQKNHQYCGKLQATQNGEKGTEKVFFFSLKI